MKPLSSADVWTFFQFLFARIIHLIDSTHSNPVNLARTHPQTLRPKYSHHQSHLLVDHLSAAWSFFYHTMKYGIVVVSSFRMATKNFYSVGRFFGEETDVYVTHGGS